MPITVAIEDESGRQIRPLLAHPHLDAALRGADEDGCCLQFIDPYGDTVFNQLQIAVLIPELMTRRLDIEEPGPGDAIEQLVALVRSVQGEAHTYVRFIGD